jgi:hypothetical protein
MIWFDKEDRRQIREQLGRMLSVILILAFVALTLSKFIPRSVSVWIRDEVWPYIVCR